MHDVRTVLTAQIQAISEVVDGLSDADLVRATGCEGWRVADLVVHLQLGGADLLIALAERTDAAADRDFVSYWQDWPPNSPATFADLRRTWAVAASYATAAGLRRHFADVVSAASNASRAAPAGRVRFQGHVLEVEDLLTTWAVEFALHHLDLLVEIDGRQGPRPEALDLVALTLDRLLGVGHPPWWARLTYLRKGTGRQALDIDDREFLGEDASRYPAFG